MTEKLLFTGKTHNTNGPAGGAHGNIDVTTTLV
jgi:hypothetical protein